MNLCALMRYFYPRSPCGERPQTVLLGAEYYDDISIHALLAESDAIAGGLKLLNVIFLSTLSLRRATKTQWALLVRQRKFLSTLSLRRATRTARLYQLYNNDFYPRSPCGERPFGAKRALIARSISIHALLAESDGCVRYCIHARGISIHALLAESDVDEIPYQRQINKFLSTLSLRRATVLQS